VPSTGIEKPGKYSGSFGFFLRENPQEKTYERTLLNVKNA